MSNKNLQRAIKASLGTIRPGINNIEMIPPSGWQIIRIRGDGTCGYHAIMRSLLDTDYRSYYFFLAGRNKIHAGFKLREQCKKNLETILNNVNSTKIIFSFSNINKNQKNTAKKYLNSIIDENGLDFFIENNIDSLIIFLEKNIKEVGDYEEGKYTNAFIEGYIIYMIGKILNKNIFIYDYLNKKWTKPTQKIQYENISENNSLFIIFNGIHYDTLIPYDGLLLKDTFNNIPNSEYFNYNFIKK
jgi:hypothetical protein